MDDMRRVIDAQQDPAEIALPRLVKERGMLGDLGGYLSNFGIHRTSLLVSLKLLGRVGGLQHIEGEVDLNGQELKSLVRGAYLKLVQNTFDSNNNGLTPMKVDSVNQVGKSKHKGGKKGKGKKGGWIPGGGKTGGKCQKGKGGKKGKGKERKRKVPWYKQGQRWQQPQYLST